MIRDRRLPFANEADFEEAERQRGLRMNERKRKARDGDGTERAGGDGGVQGHETPLAG